MILCFLKPQATDADVEIRKFWLRIWPENDLSAVCTMSFVVHNREDSHGLLREVQILVPRRGLNNFEDISPKLLDPTCSFPAKCTMGHEVEDHDAGVVNYDGLENVRVCTRTEIRADDRGENCTLLHVRLDHPLKPGETCLCAFTFSVASFATKPHNSPNRLHCRVQLFTTRGDLIQVLQEVDLEHREIPAWSNYPEGTVSAGFDVVMYAPAGSEPEPDSRQNIMFTESDLSPDGGTQAPRHAAIWRLRHYKSGLIHNFGWEGITIGCRMEPPVLADEVRRQSKKSDVAIWLGVLALIGTLFSIAWQVFSR